MEGRQGLRVGLGTMVAQAGVSGRGDGGGGRSVSGSGLSSRVSTEGSLDEGRSLRVMLGNVIGNPRWHEEFSKFFERPSVANGGVVRDSRGIVRYRLRAVDGSGLQGELELQRREDGRYRLLVNGQEVANAIFGFDPSAQRFFLLEGDQAAVKSALAGLKVSPTAPPSGRPSFVRPRYRAMQPTGGGVVPEGGAGGSGVPSEAAPRSESEQGDRLLELLLPILVMSMVAGRGGNAVGGQSSLPSVFVV